MRTPQYHTATLEALFHKEQIVTLDDMKAALGTTARMTVFRKLKTLSYRASYSHAGRYYTLDSIARFDANGLFAVRSVCFSRYGSLLNTAEALVCASEAGLFAEELHTLVQVRVHTSLLHLTMSDRLRREQIAHGYLYLSPKTWKLQLTRRKEMLETAALQAHGTVPGFDTPDVKEALQTFLAQLNERQRRLYVGFESLKLGHGGDALLSRLTGMNVKTIAKGRQELLSHDITVDRVRRAGGGRHPVEKKQKSSHS